MKKFFLYLGVIGFLPSAAMAASAAQTTYTTTANRFPAATTTINVRPSVTEFKELDQTKKLATVQAQLDDDSVENLTFDRQFIVDNTVNYTLLDDVDSKIPYMKIDGDITDDANFHTLYELDDDGIKSQEITLEEFRPFISCKTHPQLCEIKEWDPEVEVVNPFENRLLYCEKYEGKCKIRDDLVTKYIKHWKILKPITYPRKIIPLVSFNCFGVTCGEGQRCINGCCHYVKQLPEIVAPIALKPALRTKYKLVDNRVVALPQALKDGTAKLVLNSTVNKDLLLDKKVLMERATNILQAKITALSK